MSAAAQMRIARFRVARCVARRLNAFAGSHFIVGDVKKGDEAGLEHRADLVEELTARSVPLGERSNNAANITSLYYVDMGVPIANPVGSVVLSIEQLVGLVDQCERQRYVLDRIGMTKQIDLPLSPAQFGAFISHPNVAGKVEAATRRLADWCLHLERVLERSYTTCFERELVQAIICLKNAKDMKQALGDAMKMLRGPGETTRFVWFGAGDVAADTSMLSQTVVKPASLPKISFFETHRQLEALKARPTTPSPTRHRSPAAHRFLTCDGLYVSPDHRLRVFDFYKTTPQYLIRDFDAGLCLPRSLPRRYTPLYADQLQRLLRSNRPFPNPIYSPRPPGSYPSSEKSTDFVLVCKGQIGPGSIIIPEVRTNFQWENVGDETSPTKEGLRMKEEYREAKRAVKGKGKGVERQSPIIRQKRVFGSLSPRLSPRPEKRFRLDLMG